MPAITVDVSPPTSSGTVHPVASGGDLQAALDAAMPGDVIELEAGAVFVGNFRLPNKAGADWITVRTAAIADLPAGVRVGPADVTKLAALETAIAAPVLETEDGAHHFRFEGLELRAAAGVDVNDTVVLGSATETDPAAQAAYLVFDRCYVHGDPVAGGKRGFRLNSAHTAIIDSHVSDYKREGQDTQAILGWNGPGPFKIVNNYLEGAAENVMFGGADSRSAGMNPADIELCKNHIAKPIAWKNEVWSVKNLFELKNGSRVLVSGNVFENNWAAAQNGFGILMKSVNQDGTAPWCITEDITFVYNAVLSSENGVNVSARGDGNPTDGKTSRLLFAHNVFDSKSGMLVQLLNDLEGFQFIHNTGFAVDSLMSFDSGVGPGANLVVRDNILGHGAYGVKGSGSGTGTSSLEAFYSPYTFTGNVLVLDGAEAGAAQYPDGNFFADTTASVGFADAAGGDFGVTAASPYAGAATDGTNPGADTVALGEAIAGVAK